MKKMFILSILLSLAAVNSAQAYWNFNFGLGCPAPVYAPRVVYRPVRYVCPPIYYAPCPVYQPAVVHYVDYRDPGVAMMQDGFNCMFNAMSYASQPRRHCRR